MAFTLQILHASDLEGGVDAIENAPNFATVLEALEGAYANTVIISAGDNYLSGPFFNASTDFAVRAALQEAYQNLFGEPGLTNIREGGGRTDIAIANILGIEASAIGNHEFDLGSDAFESIIEEDVRGPGLGDIRHLGAQFPYLSANLDFSGDADLANLFQPLADGILENTEFGLTPADATGGGNPKKIAPATIIMEGGEPIGVVGATTQLLETISSPSGTTGTAGTVNDMPALAAVLQPVIDALTLAGVNKIILTSHLQQFALEVELAGLLSGVDVIIAGGSDTIVADATDTLRSGDTADVVGYPLLTTDLDGNPVAVVSTDGEYSYVGRLVVEFDASGNIIPGSITDAESGAFATDQAGVLAVTGEATVQDAIDNSFKGTEVQKLVEAVRDVVIAKDGDIAGQTTVFIEGRRSFVRTEETTLGNLSADANLWAAKQADPTVMVSFKNGGGIRAAIGEVDGLTGDLLPPQENPAAGKEEGDVSRLDIENALRFNNGLTLLSLSAEDIIEVLEHAVSATGPGNTPGQFPQVGGLNFAFDASLPAGERITSAAIVDEWGRPVDVLMVNGELVGDGAREFRIVTLNFLAGGGDGYPFDTLGTDRVDLGGEQDALFNYLQENFSEDWFRAKETPASEDERIQNAEFRADEVIAPQGNGDFSLRKIGEFDTGIFDESAAEIVAHDPTTQRLFFTNSDQDSVDILDMSDPTTPVQIGSLDLANDVAGFGGVNSVAVKNGLVAVAVENDDEDLNGFVAFYDTDGTFIGQVEAGNLPDMVTFTPDGTKVLVANEGEPTDAGDPAGSISIIDISGGVDAAVVTTLDFTPFDGMEAELANRGVRIFPGKSASEDFEPEYITVSEDGSTAFVSLQEANAIAVVDIEAGEIADIQGLGVKDFSIDLPTLETFDFTDLPLLGTDANGLDIDLGGFSGLFFDGFNAENGNYQFLTVPDRGPNGGEVVDGARTFNLPDYQAQIVSFELDPMTGEITITEQLLLTDGEGNPITGLPNIEGFDEIPVDAAGNPQAYDRFGADMEGIVRDPNDGTFWTVDEYRPAIYHFDENGALIDRFVPTGTAALGGEDPGFFGTETLPEVYTDHRPNRGFEAMAYDTDQDILYAFIQTPIQNPDRATSNESHVIRVLGINPENGMPVSEYVYLLDRPDYRPGGGVDKIGDATYLGDGEFAIIERDSTGQDPNGIKNVFAFNLTGATDVLNLDVEAVTGGQTLEQLSPDELADFGINPIEKIKYLNLPSLGYTPSDKPEGLTVMPDGSLAVLNDNDFGIEDSTGFIPQLGIISFDKSNGLDASDKDDIISIQHHPVFGMHMPDAISSYTVDGVTYYVTANEGDGRDFDESRIKDLVLDPVAFPNAAELQQDEVLGRLKVSNIQGDLDGDGDFDQLFSYSARSFSIFDEFGNKVFDSGDDLARIVAEFDPILFNSQGDNDSFDKRSDDKGVEPEAVTIGEVNGRTIAFIGLERAGGIAAYDVTDPFNPEFVDYINTADLTVKEGGDIAPEGIAFIDDTVSPTGTDLLAVSFEVSGTVSIFEIDFGQNSDEAGLNLRAGAGDDRVDGDERQDRVFGEEGMDRVFGNGGNDALFGGLGDDALFGGLGNDTILGGEGNDTLTGDGGADILRGEAGNDRLLGGAGNDILYGGDDNDVLIGGGGNDRLFGDLGDDTILGGEGADILSGGEGADVLRGELGDDRLLGGLGNDVLLGGEGNDALLGQDGDDRLFGGLGNDDLVGGLGVDILSGDEGDDRILGGDGDDRIYGGLGDDLIFGGSGADIIVAADDAGDDVIVDFVIGEDRVSVENTMLVDFADLQANLVQDGLDAVLTVGTGSITFQNTAVVDLTSDEFAF